MTKKNRQNRNQNKEKAAHAKRTAPKKTTVNEKLTTVTIKFKDDSNGGHNHIIVDDIGENHVSVGLTTKQKKGKNSTNKELTISPIPIEKGKKSYMRRQGTVAPKKTYRNPHTGKMLEQEYEIAKKYGARAKQKYLAKKHKKNNSVPNT